MSVISEESTRHFLDVDGIKVSYHDVGEGPVLVLLHGGGPGASGWSNYNRNIEPLSKHFRVLVPDLPGFGQSDMKTRGVSNFPWYGAYIGRFLDELNIDKAHVVGNSLGGAATLYLAMERPEKIDKMVLMGAAGGLGVSSTFPTEALKTLLFFYDGSGPSLERLRGFVDQFVFDPSLITDELLESRIKAALRPEIIENPPMRPVPGLPRDEIWRDPRLPKLTHETLIVWGREDRVMPLDMAFSYMKIIPKARLYVVPQCGHWVQWEHADEFNRAVLNFLA